MEYFWITIAIFAIAAQLYGLWKVEQVMVDMREALRALHDLEQPELPKNPKPRLFGRTPEPDTKDTLYQPAQEWDPGLEKDDV